MTKIIKDLFKYKYYIVLIIVLLIFQAFMDLALPGYTSDIVNVGIQSYGIDSITPIVIRESEYNNILNYMESSDKDKFISSYDYIPKNSSNEYKVLSEEGVYKLNKEIILDDILYKPLSYNYYNNNALMNGIDISVVDASLLKSSLINYIKSEYDIIGVNTEEIQLSYIYNKGFVMIIIAISAFILTAITTYLSSKVSASFAKDLRKDLMKKTMDLEVSDLKQYSNATLITRCTNDVLQLQGLVMVFLRIIVFAPIMGVGAIIKVKSFPLSWVIIIAVLSIFILLLILFIIVVPKFKKFQELLDRLTLVSRQILNGIPVIRAFANENIEEERFEKANNDLAKNGLFVGKSMSLLIPTLTFIMNSVAILIIFAGSKEVNSFSMQVGDLIAFITYTMQIIMSFLMLAMVAIILPRAIVSFKRISEIFNTKKTINEIDNPKEINAVNKIEFKDVSFRYPDSDENVLSNINFNINKGQILAFIGSTGSGKSTIVNLALRFYDSTSGQILINDIDIKELSIKNLREKIGYVSQKSRLFKGTIMYNLTFGQKEIDEEKAKDAAKRAVIMDYINGEEGFKKEVSEGATNVSGGQKQRISIARTLAKDSEILIFDDSFSALDFKTDSLLRKEINNIKDDKIIMIVAQRVSSIMNADKIIVLSEGRIVGEGVHEELLKTCSVYKEICDSQLGGENI